MATIVKSSSDSWTSAIRHIGWLSKALSQQIFLHQAQRDDGARSTVYRSAGSLCFRVVAFTIIKMTALFWMEE
ncbi:hypothetical protein [Halomonas litopenaei]|uniref:hypothetical protein n=1 Tax=Halomonas litopenaei TaxID=2109328 RepID=UPI001A8F2E88|nr:hypothetical protein [Halomonas litopenaei]MBN8413415.1 hypothetical protein [Halomonas litopenaei]